MIHVEGLHKSFGEKKVLRGIDLKVESGDSLVILGGSGAGKSVFLRHLAGLYIADQGKVSIDGVDLSSLSHKHMLKFRKRIGMSFQEGALFDSLSAFENVAFPIRRQLPELKEKEVRRRVHECLEMVGMPNVGDLKPSELSGGMRRRVGFARSIALRPELLLFDEPTTGLDPIMTSVLGDVIVRLREELHSTTITITHDISSAKRIATHIAMLFQGQLVHQDTNPKFFDTDQPVVHQFIAGDPVGPATEAMFR